MVVNSPLERLLILVWIALAACHGRPAVTFWDKSTNPTTESVDPKIQKAALATANSINDASLAFQQGDLRFIGDRWDMPRFFGLPYDAIVNQSIQKNGFKVIGSSAALLEDLEFKKLKSEYERAFNRMLYKLISGQSPGKEHAQ